MKLPITKASPSPKFGGAGAKVQAGGLLPAHRQGRTIDDDTQEQVWMEQGQWGIVVEKGCKEGEQGRKHEAWWKEHRNIQTTPK